MDDPNPTLEFHLDRRSGVPPYLQIVQQVKNALRLGFLQVGDQLPTLRAVVGKIAINPNMVFKAYRELEIEGLVESRQGLGTFVVQTLADDSLASHARLRADLERWIRAARQAEMEDDSIAALFQMALRSSSMEKQE